MAAPSARHFLIELPVTSSSVTGAADTVSVSDSASVAGHLTASDTVSVSDVATRLASFSRAVTELVSASDVAAVFVLARSASDSVSVADAVIRFLGSHAQVAESAIVVSDGAVAFGPLPPLPLMLVRRGMI